MLFEFPYNVNPGNEIMETSHIEILLIEDDADDAGLVKRSLKKTNSDRYLMHVKNGEEAVEYLFRSDISLPKLIIADLKMPLFDGFEFVKKIKSDKKLKIIPIVILTSSQEDKDILNAYNLGVNAYVVKPMDYTKFSESISQIVNFWLFLNQSPIF